MTRRSKREIARKVDSLETPSDATTPHHGIVYTDGDGDGYVTPDGDRVPADAAGNPDLSHSGPTVVLRGEYAENAPRVPEDVDE
ncbi:hypothetical protein [Halobacterium jilantaiense]|uniref:Uncharacterized protein n=1 Tax=Halobacterium jilantaiense TaxID=355548 RepID=A0A1I0Q0M1_9EURY|nr:hypothetical protein [Halobacterium jilantaiense]SEW20501.1 hypothetical protein SAMN04487945_2161 [Halobacterium jilantaiense]